WLRRSSIGHRLHEDDHPGDRPVAARGQRHAQHATLKRLAAPVDRVEYELLASGAAVEDRSQRRLELVHGQSDVEGEDVLVSRLLSGDSPQLASLSIPGLDILALIQNRD